ncbi:hypothetical protein LXL04_028705 [Taraxacum kok-saghyz]
MVAAVFFSEDGGGCDVIGQRRRRVAEEGGCVSAREKERWPLGFTMKFVYFRFTMKFAYFKFTCELKMLGSFENSYIPENPRTPPISYISQTVISFKKPTSEPSKTGFETKQKTVHICTKKKFAHMQSFWKKKVFFRKFFFAAGLIFERFLAPRSRFFEKVNGLGVLGYPHNVALTTYFRLMVSSPKNTTKRFICLFLFQQIIQQIIFLGYQRVAGAPNTTIFTISQQKRRERYGVSGHASGREGDAKMAIRVWDKTAIRVKAYLGSIQAIDSKLDACREMDGQD